MVSEIAGAVAAGPLVRGALERGGLDFGVCRVVAVGKAAAAMAEAAVGVLGERVRGGVVYGVGGGGGTQGKEGSSRALRALWGDHPVPTGRNVEAAREVLRCVEACEEDESVLVLLSGGASALLCLPREGVEVGDIAAVTAGLLRAGATIGELNTVRKHCEVLKGGGLAKAAVAAGAERVVCLVLSDVLGDRLEVIGSGPTAPDPTTFAEAMGVLERRGCERVSPAVTALLARGVAGKEPETLKPGEAVWDRVENRIIGNNRLAIEAACGALERQGYEVVGVREGVEGEAAEVGRALVREAVRLRDAGRAKVAIVWGGETTVTVGKAEGTGGRCQEIGLAAAVALARERREGGRPGGAKYPGITIVTFATDGRDGPTDAAGAVVDEGTVAAMRAAGIEPEAALAQHDSYHALEAVGALVRTGPTGTNVNDLMVAVVG